MEEKVEKYVGGQKWIGIKKEDGTVDWKLDQPLLGRSKREYKRDDKISLKEEDSHQPAIFLDNGYLTELEDRFCELLSELPYPQDEREYKEYSSKAVSIYYSLSPKCKITTAKVNARKLLAMKKIKDRLLVYHKVRGTSKEKLLADRQEIYDKALEYANIAMKRDTDNLKSGKLKEHHKAFMASGRLSALTDLMKDHAKAHGFEEDMPEKTVMINISHDELREKARKALEIPKEDVKMNEQINSETY